MYQPKTGKRCTCKPGIQRDNCPQCEGTGQQIDFRAIRERKTVTRYVVTYVNRDGMRTLIGPAQGRNTYATAAEAQAYMDAVILNNSAENITQIWGGSPAFEVRPCECWAGHFDPVGVYFD